MKHASSLSLTAFAPLLAYMAPQVVVSYMAVTTIVQGGVLVVDLDNAALLQQVGGKAHYSLHPFGVDGCIPLLGPGYSLCPFGVDGCTMMSSMES